ncbi:nitroreductase family deazaflavin-dependent oxidoreductase [Rhodococcus sp. NPDC059234]|uniref:nitroreductase family deazaflavin-dependent oxidoreductase n=1 Tax=Rhodococcus sp. NPDC059234 TaxID=3346781 RepID=UPI003673082F
MTYSYRDANVLQKMMRASGSIAPISWLYARTLHRIDPVVFRMTKGRRTFTGILTGLPMVMLTTTGARSGQQRTVPLVAVPDAGRLVVIASNYGQEGNPAWYHNLVKHPDASLTIDGGEPRAVRAYEAEGSERERLWALDLEVYPGRASYQQRATGRRIPVMVLDFAAGS